MILLILNVLSLMAASAVVGFFIGRGKIEIQKKLSPQEQELIEKAAKEQQETIEKYNAMMKELSQYSGM